MTIGEMKEMLRLYPNEMELSFEPLHFYQLKQRGENMVRVEFNESIYRDENGELVLEEHL